jgi:hypothetical protein
VFDERIPVEEVARRQDEIGDLALFDAAELLIEPMTCRIDCQRPERLSNT